MPPCRAPATRTVARHPLDTAGHKVSAARLRRTLAGCWLGRFFSLVSASTFACRLSNLALSAPSWSLACSALSLHCSRLLVRSGARQLLHFVFFILRVLGRRVNG